LSKRSHDALRNLLKDFVVEYIDKCVIVVVFCREGTYLMNLTLPFQVRGKNGTVAIEYEANRDPYSWGYGLITGSDRSLLEYSPDIALSFPVCRAAVAFEGEGYNAMFGWIQIIRYQGTESGAFVDKPPQLAEVDMPYVAWGSSPTFFDAPSTSQKGIIWTADAFLVMSPDALMTKQTQPICGFHWGYTIQDGHTSILPLTPVDANAWVQACILLRGHYPRWTFESEWANKQIG
jgi:hypothetical protein